MKKVVGDEFFYSIKIELLEISKTDQKQTKVRIRHIVPAVNSLEAVEILQKISQIQFIDLHRSLHRTSPRRLRKSRNIKSSSQEKSVFFCRLCKIAPFKTAQARLFHFKRDHSTQYRNWFYSGKDGNGQSAF